MLFLVQAAEILEQKLAMIVRHAAHHHVVCLAIGAGGRSTCKSGSAASCPLLEYYLAILTGRGDGMHVVDARK